MDKLFQTESHEEFSRVTEEILNNLYHLKCDSVTETESSVIESVKENLKETIINCDFDMNKVKENLQSNSWNGDKINCFISLLEEKKSEILYSALNHHNCLYGDTVINFDWILKLVLGTNDLKSLRFPILQIMFSTSNCQREQIKTYDLTKEMVLKIIHGLEDINGK